MAQSCIRIVAVSECHAALRRNAGSHQLQPAAWLCYSEVAAVSDFSDCGHLAGLILRSRRTSADQRTSDRIPSTAAQDGEPIEGTGDTGRRTFRHGRAFPNPAEYLHSIVSEYVIQQESAGERGHHI